MRTKKRWLTSCGVAIAILLVIGVGCVVTANMISHASATPATFEEKMALEFVQNKVSAELPDGDAVLLTDDSMFEELFQKSLVSVSTDHYVYAFDTVTQIPVGVLLTGESPVSFKEIETPEDAQNYAKQLVYLVNPDFPADGVEVTCKEFGEEENGHFSIEIIKVLNEDIYGKKASVILSKDGALESIVFANMDAPAKIEAGELSLLSEEDAVELAYAAIAEEAAELETAKPAADEGAPEKTGNDIIVTDSGSAAKTDDEPEPYEIYVDARDGHEVSAHKGVRNGVTEWVVGIYKIQTNRKWDIGFEVHLDAETGEVVTIYQTR